ncbi:MAG: transglutaminase domain-containing protein [Thermoanaerobaculales bacterium]|jgi:tetratricopeptide (TPR) repeat protein|nr:transglutaminase domain-containing protein [Thermoanaerobaculales bacterium]
MSQHHRIAVAVAALVAAATMAPASEQPKISREEVLVAKLLGAGAGPQEPISPGEVLALSDEMREFLRDHVNFGATDVFKLAQLTDAVMGRASLGLEYVESTHTAAETFRHQRGNCISFAIMFAVLCRGAGIGAHFQEVDIPPDWSIRRDVYVLNRHINVRVNLGAAGIHIVDFNIADFKSTFDTDEISDRRTIAHFYNNIGFERMEEGDTSEAVAFFRLAIEYSDGDFSPAWTNLGSLYRQAGHLNHAEAAFLYALKADRGDDVAMSNLVSLYGAMGENAKAREYRKRVDEHRMRNPYYRYTLANEAFLERDYDTAISHLKVATRRERKEDEFYFLLGLSHLMKGNEKEARKYMAKAELVAADAAKKERYSTKIDMLMSASQKAD